jgi:Putative transposase of IS4/5 family (DUF4096)
MPFPGIKKRAKIPGMEKSGSAMRGPQSRRGEACRPLAPFHSGNGFQCSCEIVRSSGDARYNSLRTESRAEGLLSATTERDDNYRREENIADGRPGRKPTPTRCVLEAVLWILNTGAQWHMLPQSYPNYKTVHRRFQSWCRDEVLRRVLTDVANELRDSGALNEEKCFIDPALGSPFGLPNPDGRKRVLSSKAITLDGVNGEPLYKAAG